MSDFDDEEGVDEPVLDDDEDEDEGDEEVSEKKILFGCIIAPSLQLVTCETP